MLLAHDGVASLETGAGMSNARAIAALIAMGWGPALRVGYVETPPSNPDHRPDWFGALRRTVEAAGGGLFTIPNGTGGRERYGGASEWRHASRAAAASIRARRPDATLVIGFDTPFAGLLPALAGVPGVHHVHVPRSTGVLHAYGDRGRLALEQDALRHACAANTLVGATGTYMRAHLIGRYGVRAGDLVEVRNGAGPAPFAAEPEGLMSAPAPGRDFVFAYGRAVRYKGFHVLIEALGRMRGERPDCILVAAARGGDRAYLSELRRLWARHGITGTLRADFDPLLPAALQRSRRLRAVVVPSLEEPFGLIPAECFLNPDCHAPVVASATGGLCEQVIDGRTGVAVPPGDAGALADGIRRALALSSGARRRLLRRARAHARERFDYAGNLDRFLRGLPCRFAARGAPAP